MEQFEIGRCYFMLSFADSEGQMPLVETYVFIGTDLTKQDKKAPKRPRYFKTPDSYLKSAVRLDRVDFKDCIRAGEDTIELMLDLPQLVQQLQEVNR
jgi:hypothetical protein